MAVGKRAQAFKARMASERKAAINTVKFYYFKDDYNKAYRVWQMGTPGDVFDMVSYVGSEALIKFFESHPDMFIHGEPPEDDEH